MNTRMQEALRESILDILEMGGQLDLTARDLKRLGIKIEVPDITPERIVDIRKTIGISQDVFAQILGVAKVTVCQWEQGLKPPSGAAAVLLETVARDPRAIHYRLGINSAPQATTPAKPKAHRKVTP